MLIFRYGVAICQRAIVVAVLDVAVAHTTGSVGRSDDTIAYLAGPESADWDLEALTALFRRSLKIAAPGSSRPMAEAFQWRNPFSPRIHAPEAIDLSPPLGPSRDIVLFQLDSPSRSCIGFDYSWFGGGSNCQHTLMAVS